MAPEKPGSRYSTALNGTIRSWIFHRPMIKNMQYLEALPGQFLSLHGEEL
jgi:hypothetical protein